MDLPRRVSSNRVEPLYQICVGEIDSCHRHDQRGVKGRVRETAAGRAKKDPMPSLYLVFHLRHGQWYIDDVLCM